MLAERLLALLRKQGKKKFCMSKLHFIYSKYKPYDYNSIFK